MRNSLETGEEYCSNCEKTTSHFLNSTKFGLLPRCSLCRKFSKVVPKELVEKIGE